MDTRPVGPPSDGVTAVEVDGRISVYSPATRQLVALNDTASDVWRLCDGEHALPEIVDLLAASYEAPTGVLADDVRSAVQELIALGLLPDTR